ncbi:energy-coupling factor ABC transporter permease [Janibacter melonis]|uniref:energy-coupling factor ABC transporter permease n=1 Tax=Janibacter melonis TaxID=262209 RepID=UPI002043156F|nr:energy-coupling factor ABC transporter permease [Janibacter melonis]MCM3554122.1 energy-coupling factor ABC transporter permease [Janibacter melonis]
MHVPDGFLDIPTSVGTAAVAAGAIALSLARSRRELDDRAAPLAGLVAVFVFAAQMLNFPVGVGVSGHLLGGALAAVLVGPWVATLAVTVVLVVQALVFADGGITALGTNVLLMAVAGVWIGWTVFVAVRSVLPRRLAMVTPAAAVAAAVSVPATALVFTLLFAVGGQAPVDISTMVGLMVTWHAVIGIGEAVITALVVSAVLATRPDLVRGAVPALARQREQRLAPTTPEVTR